jgi:hypothetical protein
MEPAAQYAENFVWLFFGHVLNGFNPRFDQAAAHTEGFDVFMGPSSSLISKIEVAPGASGSDPLRTGRGSYSA